MPKEIPFCSNCRGVGHYSFECPNPTKENYSFDRSSQIEKIIFCYTCGQRDHFTSQCPTSNRIRSILPERNFIHEEIIELDRPLIDTRTCAFQGEPEGIGIFQRTPCTFGRPDDGNKPSSAFDGNKSISADNDFDKQIRYSEKFELNIIYAHPQPQPERIRTCFATWLPEMAQGCSKFQPREETKE